MPPLLADFIHNRVCKPICEKLLTLPCTPLGVKKAVIPVYSKRPNENGQKSLYQSRNGFIKKCK